MPGPRRLAAALLLVAVAAGVRLEAQTLNGATPPAPPVHQDAAGVGGTAWSPVTDSPGVHATLGAWTTMLHGAAYGQALIDSGSVHHRGRGVSSVNWLMADLTRTGTAGRLTLRTMVSAEPWTMRGCGYPDMLATGEVCDGDSIHDRQHPHDVFMELAAAYERPLRGSARVQVYGGPVGEPALGPPAFLHRASSAGNPIAPIAHHWLDSSHVSFGVATAAVFGPGWKVDASLFNGREPDDRRRNIETGRWDAWSVRTTVAPHPDVVLQVSGGHLPEAEAGLGTLPRQDVSRLTASASHVHRLPDGGTWATTLAWGVRWGRVNTGYSTADQVSHAVLAESALDRPGPTSWFARAEVVGKPAHDLHAEEFVPSVFTVGKVQVGYVRDLAARVGVQLSLGATVSAGLLPALLAPRYDGRVAPGAGIFLRLSPAATHDQPPESHEHDHAH